MTSKTLFAIGLLGLVTVTTGCPKKGPAFDPMDPRANFVQGVNVLEKPDRSGRIDYEAAYAFFRDSASLGGGPRADFNAGWVAEVLDRPADAERHYGKAYTADPSYPAAMHSYARLLTENGKPAEAAAVYRAHVEAHPDDVDARNDLVVALSNAGLYDEAVTQAREVLLKDPDNAGVYMALATMYQAQGNYPMSLLCSEKAKALDAADGGGFNNMAITYLALGEEELAIAELTKALEADPDHFEANLNLGYIALNSGDYPRALTTLEKAAAVKPGDELARKGLAIAYRGMKEYDKAEALYKEMTATSPGDATLFFNASTLHEFYTRDFDRAIAYLEAFVAKNAVGSDHEVYKRMERVRATKAEEERRLAEEAERKRAEEERERRNAELLSAMGAKVEVFKAKVDANRACLGPIADEADMLIEQANAVIETQDTGMAPDIQQMMDEYYAPMVDEAIATQCGGAPAPAP